MFDLIVKNANLQDGRSGVDIACLKGRIVAVEPNIDGEARETVDATGRLVCPPFVDAHWHLDGALLHGNPHVNESGSLYEGIDIWSKYKETQSVEDYKERARRVLSWAIANGSLHIRAQTDICEPELRAAQALIELRDELKPWIDIQLVAFPQDGYLRDPNGLKLMKRALDMGMDVVGGIPDYELTAPLGNEAVRQLCEIAERRGLLVDMHIDQTTDPQSRQIEAIAQETVRLGMSGRISASHCPSMANFDDYFAGKLLAQIAQAGMNVCVQPMVAATCWGIMARVNEMLDAGVNVAFGQDSVMDPWYPLGKGEMLDVAHMAIVWGRVLIRKKQLKVFDCITYGGAKALALQDYGIAKGSHADMVILQAPDPLEAIRIRPPRLAVIRRGEVISRQQAQTARLTLGGQTLDIDFTREDALRGPGVKPCRHGHAHHH